MRFFKLFKIKDKENASKDEMYGKIQVYPKIEYKDSFDHTMEVKDVSPPILSEGSIVPDSVLPLHEKVIKPEGNKPIYTQRRIEDMEKDEKETVKGTKRDTANE